MGSCFSIMVKSSINSVKGCANFFQSIYINTFLLVKVCEVCHGLFVILAVIAQRQMYGRSMQTESSRSYRLRCRVELSSGIGSVSIHPGPWGGSKKSWASSGTSDNYFLDTTAILSVQVCTLHLQSPKLIPLITQQDEVLIGSDDMTDSKPHSLHWTVPKD